MHEQQVRLSSSVFLAWQAVATFINIRLINILVNISPPCHELCNVDLSVSLPWPKTSRFRPHRLASVSVAQAVWPSRPGPSRHYSPHSLTTHSCSVSGLPCPECPTLLPNLLETHGHPSFHQDLRVLLRFTLTVSSLVSFLLAIIVELTTPISVLPKLHAYVCQDIYYVLAELFVDGGGQQEQKDEGFCSPTDLFQNPSSYVYYNFRQALCFL